MPAPNAVQQIQEIPLKIVGGNNFGRYNKISDEQTFNFIVSDNALVPYAGYKVVSEISETVGRGLYSSFTGQFMLSVIGNQLYKSVRNQITGSIQTTIIAGAQLGTSSGDVYISENNNAQICITDNSFIYVYDWFNNIFWSNLPSQAPATKLNFYYTSPGYISFQNGRFIVACNDTQDWILSNINDATSATAWPQPNDAYRVGKIQSKPGRIKAVVPVPGGGNNIVVMGSNVAETWTDYGLALFPYQRNSTFNIDYGCLNPSSIAELDNFVVWLAVNEQSGPILMMATGSAIKKISTDGIDYRLSQLKNPQNCTGFLFQQDGHLLYQFTFPDDNLTLAYDFNTQLFFTVTDENLNYHPARQVVFFLDNYYFVSLKDGNLYRFGTQYTNAQYGLGNTGIRIIPRIRITPPLRIPSQRYFICKSLGFTIENGEPNNIAYTPIAFTSSYKYITTESGKKILTEIGQKLITEKVLTPTAYNEYASNQVFLAISRDGAESFGNAYPVPMNPTGKRTSRLIWQRLGIANDATFQLRFIGYSRFVCFDGIVEAYQ
ncbi:MAG: hypothetical protein FGM16_09265 [Flavobacterium sp.]|nr:hypothetical protein [Flavobacterium sp.]